MDLFDFDSEFNLLPFDGDVFYFKNTLSEDASKLMFKKLLRDSPWESDELLIYRKRIVTKRKTAWYGDEPYSYTYSKQTKVALPWTVELLELKTIVEVQTNSSFNSCLLNLYHNGQEGMGWHSDDEDELGEQPVIASLSLGAERNFMFKHDLTQKIVSIALANGSLLLMKGDTQHFWQHSLPKATKISSPRINLTFRTIVK